MVIGRGVIFREIKVFIEDMLFSRPGVLLAINKLLEVASVVSMVKVVRDSLAYMEFSILDPTKTVTGVSIDLVSSHPNSILIITKLSPLERPR